MAVAAAPYPRAQQSPRDERPARQIRVPSALSGRGRRAAARDTLGNVAAAAADTIRSGARTVFDTIPVAARRSYRPHDRLASSILSHPTTTTLSLTRCPSPVDVVALHLTHSLISCQKVFLSHSLPLARRRGSSLSHSLPLARRRGISLTRFLSPVDAVSLSHSLSVTRTLFSLVQSACTLLPTITLSINPSPPLATRSNAIRRHARDVRLGVPKVFKYHGSNRQIFENVIQLLFFPSERYANILGTS